MAFDRLADEEALVGADAAEPAPVVGHREASRVR